jgi:hypothetical protein
MIMHTAITFAGRIVTQCAVQAAYTARAQHLNGTLTDGETAQLKN